ncbi:MAG TPA: PD-(D/E)XK nuclease family protein [Chloroflexota bacterium]|nr:PD-(D/E)XK nuclease family protein [Chloroflexota bacterium]
MAIERAAPSRRATVTITPTAAHNWALCGGFYAAGRQADRDREAPYALLLGTAVHELVAAYDRLQAPHEAATETLLMRHWRPGRFAAADDARAREESAAMLARYQAARRTEMIEVLAGECFARTEPRGIGDGMQIALSGRIDRVGRRPDGTLEVLDFKTAATLPSEEELRHDPATTAYHLLAAERFGAGRILIAQWSLCSGARSEVTLGPGDIAAGKEHLRTMAREIAGDAFSLTPGVACGYCPARLACPALVHEVPAPAGINAVW